MTLSVPIPLGVPGRTKPLFVTLPTLPVPLSAAELLLILSGPVIEPVTCRLPAFTIVVVSRLLVPLKFSVPLPFLVRLPVPVRLPAYVPAPG